LKSERKAHIVSFLFLAVFCILAAGSMDTPATTGTDSSPARGPAQNVSAERLFLDYQRNEVSADSMYKGRTLAVTGTVTSINKDFTDSVYLMLETSNEFMGVHANLRGSEVSKASTLSKGSTVTVVCEGSGMIVGSPMLTDCVIQPNQQQEHGVENQQVQGSNLSADGSEAPQQQVPVPVENSNPSAAQPEVPQESEPVPTEVSRALDNWAKAYESNDATLIANCYADQVDRYFLRQNVTNAFVHDYMEAWFKDHDSRVTMFRIKDVVFQNETSTTVQLRLAKEVVTTNSKGAAERLTPSQLSLKKVAGEWKITSERDFK
jgi:ketosteroid isomerase-like protein